MERTPTKFVWISLAIVTLGFLIAIASSLIPEGKPSWIDGSPARYQRSGVLHVLTAQSSNAIICRIWDLLRLAGTSPDLDM